MNLLISVIKPQKIFIVAFIISLFAQGAKSEMIVLDPLNIIGNFSHQLNPPEWSNTYKCFDNTKFVSNILRCQYQCYTNYCTSSCDYPTSEQREFVLQIEDCTNDSISILGSNGFSANVNKNEYQKHGTWIYALLKNLDYFMRPTGIVTIDSSNFTQFSVVENGNLKVEIGKIIFAHYQPFENTNAITIEIGLLRGRSIINSLAILRVGGSIGEDFLKMKGVAFAH